MIVKLVIKINMRNGDKKKIVVEEKDPKGYLVDKKTGEKREISLTDKEVKVEYAKRIAENMENKKPLFFLDIDGKVLILNPYDVSNVEINV